MLRGAGVPAVEPIRFRLQMTAIDKAFAGVPVLRNVDFAVGAGEVVALLGANGAGKSTLMKILGGVYARDAGTIAVDGIARRIATPAEAIEAGIRLLPQEVSVYPELSIAENISIASLPVRRRFGVTAVDGATMRRRASELLARLGHAELKPDRLVGTLELSQQRVVEIARALAGDARVLIMDEPTAALAQAEVERLFAVVDALRRDGVSVIYISHYLDEVFRLTDRIVVLRDGEVAGNFPTAATSHGTVLHAMLGRVVDELYPVKAEQAGPKVLSIIGLSQPGWLQNVSFDVARGEILGVFGLVGSGIERIGRAVFGAEPAARVAAAQLLGQPFRPRDPRASVAAGIGFVAAERKREGVIGMLSVRANTTAPFLRRFLVGWQVSRKAERRETQRWIDALGIRTSGPEQEIRLLSGGNQQKVCLARWLLGPIALLILEEPTRGVDLGARREIYRELRRLAADGLGIIVVSSDAEEIAGIADRTLVLRHGEIAAVLPGSAAATAVLAAASQAPGNAA
jgi:ribose transport system ATP-binding protein